MNAGFDKINICFVIDDNYAEHCAVTIASILLNSESVFHFHVLYYELSLENKNKLENLKKIKYFKITFVRVDLKDFKECYLYPDAHFSITTYFKLIISSLLPKIDKTIYLDSDTVVIRDMKELWNISFDDAYIIACKTVAHKSNCKRLGLPTGTPCINTGVMVLDLDKIREHSLENIFFNCIKQNPEKLKYADQDVINLVLSAKEGAIKQIQQNWNAEDAACLSYEADYLPIIHNPYIIHFITGEKPWRTGSRQLFKEKYWQYHHETAIVNPRKLVMTLLVRNEEDIVRYNIDFHLRKGVDFIIATDNYSTDSTRDILREYEEKGVLHLIDEKNNNHNQAEWNNRMAEIARSKYDADVIFHCDADEFWYPRSGNLKNEISNRPEDILIVDLINILPEDKGGTEAFPEYTRFAVVNPVVAKNYEEETMDVNLFYLKYPPKVIFKSRNKMLLVSQGNHAITNKDDSITEGKSQDIVIYHYPIRSRANFSKKTIMGGSAYENSDIHPKGVGFHKRRWYDSYKKGLLDEQYKKLILHEGDVDKLMREGFIEEFDFNNVILGHENKDDRWRYYNRKFEYEDMFQDFYWPWAGHKYFAYDLIRNLKPKLIVELGTHKGTSFYSFCQAVKDARYDANLYAIDTWQGDEHAGFYDDNVFKEVQEIKEKHYSGLKINLLRKNFDEAVGEFENNSIDLLHIDGLHTYNAVKHDFDTWFHKVKTDGIILMHDIFISRADFGVYKFWEELKSEYKTIEFHQAYGLGVLFKDSARYSAFMDKEREWQIRYSYIAEDKKNEETSKSYINFDKSLAERDGQIASLNQAIAELEVKMRILTSSNSWRLAKPLRFLGRILRGAFKTAMVPFREILTKRRVKEVIRQAKTVVDYIIQGDFYGLLKKVRARKQFRAINRIQTLLAKPKNLTYWGIMTTQHTLFIAYLVADRLRCHGWNVDIMTKSPAGFPHDWYVVICPQMFKKLPPRDKRVIFQMEQSVNARWWTDAYLETLKNSLAVLEYAIVNLGFMASKGVAYPQVHYLPVGASASYGNSISIRTYEKICDILFYGVINSSSRRREMLDVLMQHFNVRVVSDVFGSDMLKIIKQARLVINLHYCENALLEVPRIQECLSLGVPVVSESAQDQEDYPELAGAVRFFEQGSIPAMLNAVKAALEHPAPAEKITESVELSTQRFAFMFDRFLIAMGFLPASHVSRMSLPLPKSANRVALSLPETIARRRIFEMERPAECTVFDGIRQHPGWVGCGLSYRALALHAMKQGKSRLNVMEDDVLLPHDFEVKMAAVHEFLDARPGKWDVFAGVIASLHPDVKILSVDVFKDITFVTINKMTSMVFNIYNEKALRLLASWNSENLDVESNTIDRYLENQADLRVVVTLPFLVGHRNEVYSTLWSFQNSQYIEMIAKSEQLLARMILAKNSSVQSVKNSPDT